MRTREVPPGAQRGRIEHPPVSGRPVYPEIIDRDLTVFRDGLRWSFAGGRILVDGQDINHLITHNPAELPTWLGLAEGLGEYRKRVFAMARESDQFTRFEAVIEAVLGKIFGRLKKVYDQKLTGLSWHLHDGQLILNGINVRSFLALYRIRKTEKARKFLRGLQGKLALLLENRHESPDNERIREIIEEVYRQVVEELDSDPDQTSARSSRRLLPGGAHAS